MSKMQPTDPRHGTPAGYVAGCHDICCRIPRQRQQKRARIAKERGVKRVYTADEVDLLIKPWEDMGFSRTAIAQAAGVSSDHLRANRHGPVLAGTYTALAKITEPDFHERSYVPSDLTRRRIFSLMAIGHPLKSMPLNPTGKWRTSPVVTVKVARIVRDYYATHEAKVGPSLGTMAQARGNGHLPPLAWDDPGTLAWPHGIPDIRRERPRAAAWSEVDHAVVERVLAGERLPTTRAEKFQIMARWLAAGRTEKSLCDRMGWNTSRYLPADMGATA